jgi:uncharacterized repeat protein (TIGR03803 family)
MRPERTGNAIKLSLKSALAVLVLTSVSLVEAQTLQTLYSFTLGTDGWYANALTLGNDGNFYGTTIAGGSAGNGTVFQVTTNGTLTTLVAFNFTNGASPMAALTLGNDGNFYGTTAEGGITNSSGYGTVFKVTTNGALTTLAAFNFTNGAGPYAELTQGNDGNFYGTTKNGGITNSIDPNGGMGTVFKVTTNGTLTTLASFNYTNGSFPMAALTLGNEGNFYGPTANGGDLGNGYYGRGTVFKVTTNGALTTLAVFNFTNGAPPTASLTMGTDGNFYGTTAEGGITNSTYTLGMGTVFKVTTNGALTTLVAFNFTNGAFPMAALTLGNEGNFYGTTAGGGITNSSAYGSMGTVFQVTTNGALTTLVAFNSTNGADPYAGLTLGNDGNFYGTTAYGGSGGLGTVFRLSLQPVITFQPQSQTNNAGATGTFLVSATGLYPMFYQWQKNGTNLVDGGNISGTTTNALAITVISDSDAANYSVIVSNSYGSVTTSSATLAVDDFLFIASQPQSQTVSPGSNVAFSVTVYGAPPFVFQWYFNGTPVGLPATGTNCSSYTLTNVGTNQAGYYSVEVFNGYGSLLSSNALLAVIVPPTLALEFLAGYPLLNLSGMLSSNFVVQYNTNLPGTNWRNLLSLTNLLASPYLFLDPAGDAEPARFYRAFMQ